MVASKGRFLKFALVYGLKNLSRNPRRSTLLLGSMVLAVGVSIVAHCYTKEILNFWVEQTINAGPGQAQVHRIGFKDETNTVKEEFCFSEGGPQERILATDPQVDTFGRRLEVEGLVSAKDKSIYFLGLGLEAEKEAVVSPLLLKFSEGVEHFLVSSEKNSVAIGKGLADSLDVGVGEPLTLTVQTVRGTLNAIDVKVRGIVNFPDIKFSKRIIYLNLALAQDLLALPQKYNEIALRLKKETHLQKWSDQRQKDFSRIDAELSPWWEIFPPILKIQEIWRSVVTSVSGLLFLSMALSIQTIIFLTVGERNVEIGVLRSLGATKLQILNLFGIESILLGAIGGVIGAMIGAIFVVIMGYVGFPLVNPFFDGFVYVYPKLDFVAMGTMIVFAILVAFFSSLLPARKASKVEPVVAFRGQLL